MPTSRKQNLTHFDAALDGLRQLRDQVRVRAHLAGMDAKDALRGLEPRLARVERAIHSLRDRLGTWSPAPRCAVSLAARAGGARGAPSPSPRARRAT